MEESLKTEIKRVLSIVQEARKYTEPFNGAKLFEICQDLIARQAWLISPLLEAETKYREKILEFRENYKTKAEAEIRGKITEEYKDYKYIEYAYELVNQQIMLVKKFASALQEEKSIHL